jgi:hypothetical protein
LEGKIHRGDDTYCRRRRGEKETEEKRQRDSDRVKETEEKRQRKRDTGKETEGSDKGPKIEGTDRGEKQRRRYRE